MASPEEHDVHKILKCKIYKDVYILIAVLHFLIEVPILSGNAV